MKIKTLSNDYILTPFIDDHIPEDKSKRVDVNVLEIMNSKYTGESRKRSMIGCYDKDINSVRIFDTYNDDRFTKDEFEDIIKNFVTKKNPCSFVIFRDCCKGSIGYLMAQIIYQDLYEIESMDYCVCETENGKEVILGYVTDIDYD